MEDQDIVTKRLHISGLTRDLTLDLVKKRFQALGQIVDSTPPGKNALGDDQRFGYLEVRAPRASIKKCVNGLSGATWNNSKLRIADAKPDYKQRIEKERLKSMISSTSPSPSENKKSTEETSSENKKKKAKRLPKGMGIESPNVSSPITVSEVKSGEEWGWNLTPAGHLIRPLVLRPDHPLPKPAVLKNDPKVSGRKDRIKKDENSKEISSKDEKMEKKEKKSRKRKLNPNSKPPVRSNRIIIDPARYGSQHLSGLVLDSYDPEIEKMKKERGIWICKDDEEGVESGGKQRKRVKWVHIKDGEEVEEKKEVFDLNTRPNPKSARSELFDDLDESVKGNSDFEFEDQEEEEEEEEEDQEEQSNSMIEEEMEKSESSKQSESDSSSSPEGEGSQEVEDEKISVAKQIDEALPSKSTVQEPPKSVNKSDPSKATSSNFKPLPFDPDSRSDFSEGYDENLQNENRIGSNSGIGPSHDFASERDRTKTWLSSVFGEGFLEGKESMGAADQSLTTTRAELVEDPEEDEEWDSAIQPQETPVITDEHDQDGVKQNEVAEENNGQVPSTGAKSRRAALLAPALKAKTQRSFQPHARFDPRNQPPDTEQPKDGTDAMAVEEDQDSASGGKKEIEIKKDGAIEGEKSHVQMTSLKDMFKPQEDVKGFSLLGGLDLDLDEELDFLADEPDEEDETNHENQTNHSIQQVEANQPSTSASNFYLFPKFDHQGRPRNDAKNFLKILSSPLELPRTDSSQQHRGGRFDREDLNANQIIRPKAFCRDETEEQRKERWERNKQGLTAEYKRRHREAVKKKRRKVEGGKVIPGR